MVRTLIPAQSPWPVGVEGFECNGTREGGQNESYNRQEKRGQLAPILTPRVDGPRSPPSLVCRMNVGLGATDTMWPAVRWLCDAPHPLGQYGTASGAGYSGYERREPLRTPTDTCPRTWKGVAQRGSIRASRWPVALHHESKAFLVWRSHVQAIHKLGVSAQ